MDDAEQDDFPREGEWKGYHVAALLAVMLMGLVVGGTVALVNGLLS